MGINASVRNPTKKHTTIVPSDVEPGELQSPMLLLSLGSEDSYQTFEALYVGVTGHVNLVDRMGNIVLFSNVPVGVLEVPGFRVLATGTTATNMVGINRQGR